MAIVAENRIEECRQEFLYIVGRGKFVGFMDGPLFDGFKQDVECRLEVLVLQLMKEAFEAQDYAETVSLAEAEFNIDPVNETALSCCLKSLFILKHENAAIGTYQKFVAEYKNIRGKIILILSVFTGVSSPARCIRCFQSSLFLFFGLPLSACPMALVMSDKCLQIKKLLTSVAYSGYLSLILRYPQSYT